ncbi:MAG: hypothetical protein ACK57G_01525 [Planctomycetota bacterium]|jgi:hypothetical protein
MSDPAGVLGRFMMLCFVPIMLIAPLLWAVLTPNRVGSESQRMMLRTRLSALVIFTCIALAAWLGLLLMGLQLPNTNPIAQAHRHMWVAFFPLWFGLAMPLVRAKSYDWQPSGHSSSTAQTEPLGPTVRSASLANRAREMPIRSWEWALGISLSLACIVWIAMRGLYPFANPEAIEPGQVSFYQWALSLSTYAVCIASQWFFVPYSVKLSYLEPEPMDSSGSGELQEMYRQHRRQKIRLLYWMTGVLLPAFLGTMVAWMVWWPEHFQFVGVVGAIGGSVLGIAGGIIGTLMGAQRMRIAEFKSRLDAKTGTT